MKTPLEEVTSAEIKMWLPEACTRHPVPRRCCWDIEIVSSEGIFVIYLPFSWASLVAQMVKNLPEMQETHVQSMGQEEPLEKGMTTHSNSLSWRIPWTEEPGELQSMGLQRVGHDFAA